MVISYNPYIVVGSPKLQQSLVAFVDILGYKDRMRNSIREGNTDKFLRKLYHALEESREYVDPQYADIFREAREKDFFAFSAFTHNIVIGYPIQHFGEAELIELWSIILLSNISCDGRLLRKRGNFSGRLAHGQNSSFWVSPIRSSRS